ncbi:hypothetical protein [Pseudomonas sp. TE3610]
MQRQNFKTGILTFILKPSKMDEQAYQEMGAQLRQLAPDEMVLYTSGRASLEASFKHQLLARAYGTNNLARPESSSCTMAPHGFPQLSGSWRANASACSSMASTSLSPPMRLSRGVEISISQRSPRGDDC